MTLILERLKLCIKSTDLSSFTEEIRKEQEGNEIQQQTRNDVSNNGRRSPTSNLQISNIGIKTK